jgi:hypothetical protein
MIPAPLRAPPTGITDAGYKVWQSFLFWGARTRVAFPPVGWDLSSGELAIAPLDRELEIASRSGSEEVGHNIRAARLEELG